MHSHTCTEAAWEGWNLSRVAKFICDNGLTEIGKKLHLFFFLNFSYKNQDFSKFDPEASSDSLLLFS